MVKEKEHGTKQNLQTLGTLLQKIFSNMVISSWLVDRELNYHDEEKRIMSLGTKVRQLCKKTWLI